ncbi:Transcriptional activator tipA [Planococcus halocryophilus Or1]|uniref:MerR family transcriptional regulator n=1 Tax=Planococcus halocryophilus TaxID=1215089 RepID=A0A1C7DTD9_9BACL|nr:MerR family transcriptional regulator [Planococcus halocryophilus]ANU14869.1 MerR family transcriptional regulator [Planococcus halocryophilus]EMF47786.1 Transcriptional activator tipA [Planococcus halocryophilus Or1]
MEYTVQKLANLSEISTRTLRYYDEFDLLKPARKNSSGYRIYGQSELDKLQQILFYRELGLGLEQIKNIINDPEFDGSQALAEHREKLLAKRVQLDLLISNVEKTISAKEGASMMADTEKFQGFKQKLVDDNEQQYGNEIRSKYGDELVDRSNAKMLKLSEEDYQKFMSLEQQILSGLVEAMKTGAQTSETAQQIADLHRQWLSFTWPTYSKEAHRGLAEMYVADERFAAYYDKVQPGAAQFLRDAIRVYTS